VCALLLYPLTLTQLADAKARRPKAVSNAGDIILRPVPDLNQSGAGTTVVGGKKADTKEWEASLYPASDADRCSATLIGPKALLLAAHCVGDGKKVTFTKDGVQHSGTCTHSGDYKKDESADYALCLIIDPISMIKFETVIQDPSLIRVGSKITLTGYGCTQYPQAGGNDGIFRTAEPVINAIPGQPGNERNTILVYDKNIGICSGDSGSGAFIYVVAATKRVIAAVNSREYATDYTSYLSSLTTTDAQRFLLKWTHDNNDEKICGVNFFYPDDCQ
jgi:hypothetical protein